MEMAFWRKRFTKIKIFDNSLSNITFNLTYCSNIFLEKCNFMLKNENSPLFYKKYLFTYIYISNRNPKICENMVIPTGIPCLIIIKFEYENYTKWIKKGHGSYFGDGYVLTAYHLFKKVDPNSEILVVFNNAANLLIYKAAFPEFCNIDKDKDQAFIQLCVDTTPLGEGLQKQLGKINKNGKVVFRKINRFGNILKRRGKVSNLNLSTFNPKLRPGEFLINIAGEAGDSGLPVCDSKGKLIGVYQGILTNDKNTPKFGFSTEISPDFYPTMQLKDSFTSISSPEIPVVSDKQKSII